MANQYLKIEREEKRVIKTYPLTGGHPQGLFVDTCEYLKILKRSRLNLPKTTVRLQKNTLTLEQELVEGVRLNDCLTDRPGREELRGVLSSVLLGVSGSIGSVKKVDDHWVSSCGFAADCSFSNFIVSRRDRRVVYVDIFPPRLTADYLGHRLRWDNLLVDIPETERSPNMRFKIYDLRGMLFDVISHLLYYLEPRDLGIVKATIAEIIVVNPDVAELLADIGLNLNYYEGLFVGYLKHKKVSDDQLGLYSQRLKEVVLPAAVFGSKRDWGESL